MWGTTEPATQREETVTFEAFALEALPRLVRFARWVTGGSEDAQDLVHDALVRTGARWSHVVHRGDPEWYVRRAIVNGHTDRFRRRRRESLVETVPEVADHTMPEVHDELWRALRALPRGQRAVVTLRFLEDTSVADTARLLGTSEGTVKSQSARALATLRTRLSATGTGQFDGSGLVGLASLPEQRVRPGAGPALRREVAVRKRRTALEAVATVAVVCALLAGGILVAGSGQRRAAPVFPATPSPSVVTSPSTVAPSTPPPTTTSGGSVDGKPSPSVSADVDPASSLHGFTSVLAREQDEGSLRVSATGTWPLNPCGDSRGFATDGDREAFSKTSWSLGDSWSATTVALYPDDAAAAAAFDEFEALVDECGNQGTTPPTAGDEALLQWHEVARNDLGKSAVDRSRRFRYDLYDPSADAGALDQDAADVVLARAGKAVLLVLSGSPYGRAADGGHPMEGPTKAAAQREVDNLEAFLEE